MSSLLEQAIIDATALREAAVKNAETAILDKYSTDIRDAVESLLEQDEEMATLGDDTGRPDLSSKLEDSIPLAASTDAALDEQEIVIDFKDLKAMAEQLTDAEDSPDGADPMGEKIPHPLNIDDQEITSAPVEVSLEEEIEIDIEDLDELVEELVVDITPQKSGWAGTPNSIMNYKVEMELAHRSGTQALAQVQALTQAGERLSEANNTLKAKNAKMLEALQILKENFNKINLSNARLVYTNKVLTDNSLNERQKTKIVDALSKSDSIEEAKVIFETLKSAVGSVTGKTHPQSLREFIERPSAILPRREARANYDSPVMDRMQILAGIKTHNKGDL
tara:strand:- start:47 stop:1054 length:1008 start_codon:yes stop_codon:yes gene_type:complete